MENKITWTGENLTDVIKFMNDFNYEVQILNTNKTITFDGNNHMIMVKKGQTIEIIDSKAVISRG